MAETKIKEAQVSDLTHTDVTAIHDDEANEISGLAEKTTLSGADLFIIEDSEASWVKKKVKSSNIGGTGSATFLGLTDVDPSSYSGQAGKSAVVNSGEDGMEFVLVSGSSGGTPDYTWWNPNAPPDSGSSYDDEFENSSFNTTLWTEFDNDSELTVTEDQAGLLFSPTSASDIMGIWQPNPSESYWSIYTRVHPLGSLLSTSLKAGIIVYEDANSNPTTCDLLTFGFNLNTSGVAMMIEHWDDYNSHNSNILYQYNDFPVITGGYLRVRYHNLIVSDYLVLDYSSDGISWSEIYSVDTGSYFTPDEIGLFIKAESSGYATRFSFFRVTTTEQDNPIELLQGNRVNGYFTS